MHVQAAVLGNAENTRWYEKSERNGNNKVDGTLGGYWCLEERY